MFVLLPITHLLIKHKSFIIIKSIEMPEILPKSQATEEK